MLGSNKVNWTSHNVKLTHDDQLIRSINIGNYTEVKRLVESRTYTQTDLNNIHVDTQKNSLLHLAVMNNDINLVTYFLEQGVSFSTENKMGYSAWDLAVAFRYNDIMEKIISHRVKTENTFSNRVNELSTKVDLLESKNKDLQKISNTHEISSRMFKTELNDLTVRYNTRNRDVTVLSTENAELRMSNKRLRDENVNLVSENNDLKDKNKKLKSSVETLMANTKK